MKHLHLYIILATLLCCIGFARPSNPVSTQVNQQKEQTSADTTGTVDPQLRSSQRIDSIRQVMASRRNKMPHVSRPSLRAQYVPYRPEAVTSPKPSASLPTDSLTAANDSTATDSIAIMPTIDTAAVSADTTRTAPADSIRIVPTQKEIATTDTTIQLAADTAALKRPQGKPSRLRMEKVDIDAEVDFAAKDSLVMIGQDIANMYGESEIQYGKQMNITAENIKMDMVKNMVYAAGAIDTAGEEFGLPVFKDNSGSYESKTMQYNFKTNRGFITDVVTEQGEGYLTGGKTKKMEDDIYYMTDGKYTTCDNHEHPHFYLQLTKAKMRPKKDIVTGPAYMVLCDVPLPLAVPFGYFPFTSKYSSGIIMPTFGDDYSRGFYLSNGGYYFAINDYIDLALTGEIYTKGSWGLTAQSSYRMRYKFSGNFNISYLTTITGDKGSPDYSKQKNFRVSWTHSQDAKANPNLTFSASVNFATSGYERNDINSYYTDASTENTKNSAVNMSYRLSSKFQISTTASIAQRTADSTLTVSFPNLTLSLSQVAPFKRKRAVGAEKWYEKIKLSYTGYFQNNLTAKQNEFLKKSLIKDWNNGMRHSVPVSATFNLFQYINVSPSISMNDRMYTRKIRRSWDPAASAEVMDTTYNFYNVFDFNASVAFDTKIYGFFQPLKFLGDKVQMIRHVLSPTVTFSGSPDFSKPFWGYYGQYNYVDNNGVNQTKKYSYFENNIFGSVGTGKTGMVTMSLANNVEMKVKSDKDSTGVKKISLIENFTISQSYNFAADSLNWSNINTSVSLRLVKNFNLNLSATWDPYTYQLNESGAPVRVNKTRWQVGKGWAKLSSTGTSFSYTFNNSTFKDLFGKKDKKDVSKGSNTGQNTTDTQTNTTSDSNRNESKSKSDGGYELDSDGYAKWSFPWSLTLNYSVNYSYGDFNKEKMDYNGKFTQNLSFSGRVQPTKGWNFNFSASYNFDTKKLSYMNCTVSRDLHCFTMSASFVPLGPYKSYNFHIAVKSSLLQDLKYDKRSSSYNGVDWY